MDTGRYPRYENNRSSIPIIVDPVASGPGRTCPGIALYRHAVSVAGRNVP